MDTSTRLVFLVAILGGAACAKEAIGDTRAALSDGQRDPTTFGLSADPSRDNAVVSVRHNDVSCTGTLVSEHVILTAVHCVVVNHQGWSWDGEAPEVVEPVDLEIFVGTSRRSPVCGLAAQAVHIHPEVSPHLDMGFIRNDIAAIVLESASSQNCSEITPIPALEGMGRFTSVLIAGYGPEGRRRWGRLRLSETFVGMIVASDQEEGMAERGDSGGPLLAINDDGRPTIVAVTSTVVPAGVVGIDLATIADFYEPIITAAAAPVDAGTAADAGTADQDAGTAANGSDAMVGVRESSGGCSAGSSQSPANFLLLLILGISAIRRRSHH